MSCVQLALRVADLEGPVAFYSKLFAPGPANRRRGYAIFAIAEPPLKLVLIEGTPARPPAWTTSASGWLPRETCPSDRCAGLAHFLCVTPPDDLTRRVLVRRGLALEWSTLGWNVAGIVVLAFAAVTARSVALAGFGLDSLIEIGASLVVVWELSGTGADRQRRGLRLIGYAFAALAAYLLVQSTVVLATGYHSRHSVPGIIWTAVTAGVMFTLAAGKARTGRELDNPVLRTEGRVTAVDGILAVAVLAGLVLNAAAGWWWADPAAGYVLVYYAAREVREIFTGHVGPE
jgi:hypothetical protein